VSGTEAPGHRPTTPQGAGRGSLSQASKRELDAREAESVRGGKADVKDISFTYNYDKASPSL